MSQTLKKEDNKSILYAHATSSTPLVWFSTKEEYRGIDYEQKFLLRNGGGRSVSSQFYRFDATNELKESVIRAKTGETSFGRSTVKLDHPKKVLDWFCQETPGSHEENDPGKELAGAGDYAPPGSVLVMFDIAASLLHPPGVKHSNALLTRVIKKNISRLAQERKMIVIVSHTKDVPQELEHVASLVEHALPDTEDLVKLVTTACSYFAAGPDDRSGILKLTPDQLDTLVGQLTGMTYLEAENVLAHAAHHNKVKRRTNPKAPPEFELSVIRQHRVQAVRKNSALEVLTPIGGLDQVGGHGHLKTYVQSRRRMFTREAKIEGLSSPKGILLCGISGTGKSMLSQCIAAEWGATILRGDVGACKAGLVGASENNFRKLLKDAEDQAGENSPVVLQLDEAGKMFGGGLKGQGNLDSGVSSGLSAIFLTWRQECKKPVYVIMTANEDAKNFPAEWLRPGRMDKVFFVDLPNLEDRKEVFNIHLSRRDWTGESVQVDVDELARKTEGFTPAEIELAVEEGILLKWETDGPRPKPVKTEHFLKAISGIKPMSQTNADDITDLRAWAKSRGYVTAPEVKAKPARRPAGRSVATDIMDAADNATPELSDEAAA